MDETVVPLALNGKGAGNEEAGGSKRPGPAAGAPASDENGHEQTPEPGGGGDDEPVFAPSGNGHDPTSTLTVAVPLLAQVEAVLFVTDGPIALTDLAKALHVTRNAVSRAITDLAGGYDGQRGLRLQRTNGLVQLVSAPETAGAVAKFIGLGRSSRLSGAALETLSIVAYRQPVTRPEIDELRGVDSDAVVRSLAARGLVEPIGRRETVGHPIEYSTTFLFLEYFGLSGLDDLPFVERDVPSAPPDEDGC